ncbi:SUF system NifU family Fe-S cluster assembly protein [Candidatus Woesearchaeota archaeon]|jgi:nitrogen fixation NifU-like protein|nr:SUF system NifU family Fe-S cluster assembly protein [Candidatus Woesearchaeota archaeon]
MSDLYRQIILEHYKNPLNKGKLLNPTVTILDSNPLCGDNIELFLLIKNDVLKDISFEGKGCALSIASASILSEHVKNKNINEIKNMTREDVYALLGIDVSPARNKCVMLALSAIKKSIFNYEKIKGD